MGFVWYNLKKGVEMFNTAIQNLMEKERRMQLGGYEVEAFDRDKATVAGTKVTRGELETLVEAMKKLPDFNIENLSDANARLYKDFINFRLSAPHDGWVSTKGDGYSAKQADFCLRTPYAQRLFHFLAEELDKRDR